MPDELSGVSMTPGDAGGEGADHQDPVQQAHLPGALQEQGQRPQLQRDPQAEADGAAAPGGDARSARAVSSRTRSQCFIQDKRKRAELQEVRSTTRSAAALDSFHLYGSASDRPAAALPLLVQQRSAAI